MTRSPISRLGRLRKTSPPSSACIHGSLLTSIPAAVAGDAAVGSLGANHPVGPALTTSLHPDRALAPIHAHGRHARARRCRWLNCARAPILVPRGSSCRTCRTQGPCRRPLPAWHRENWPAKCIPQQMRSRRKSNDARSRVSPFVHDCTLALVRDRHAPSYPPVTPL